MPPELYELGKTTNDFDGVTLSVYDRERTICDCLKYRSVLISALVMLLYQSRRNAFSSRCNVAGVRRQLWLLSFMRLHMA